MLELILLKVGIFGLVVLTFLRLLSISQQPSEERNIFLVVALGGMLFGFIMRLFEIDDSSQGKQLATWSLFVYFTLDLAVKRHLPAWATRFEEKVNRHLVCALTRFGLMERRKVTRGRD